MLNKRKNMLKKRKICWTKGKYVEQKENMLYKRKTCWTKGKRVEQKVNMLNKRKTCWIKGAQVCRICSLSVQMTLILSSWTTRSLLNIRRIKRPEVWNQTTNAINHIQRSQNNRPACSLFIFCSLYLLQIESMKSIFMLGINIRHRKRRFTSVIQSNSCTIHTLTHCGRVTQICVFNTVKLGTSKSSP